jgi:hypothetical protein
LRWQRSNRFTGVMLQRRPVEDKLRRPSRPAMMMRVRELGNEIHVELTGVAGRQQTVLRAINHCQKAACGDNAADSAQVAVHVRAGTNAMHIRLKGRDGHRFDADAVYRCLRAALLDRSPPTVGVPA